MQLPGRMQHLRRWADEKNDEREGNICDDCGVRVKVIVKVLPGPEASLPR